MHLQVQDRLDDLRGKKGTYERYDYKREAA